MVLGIGAIILFTTTIYRKRRELPRAAHLTMKGDGIMIEGPFGMEVMETVEELACGVCTTVHNEGVTADHEAAPPVFFVKLEKLVVVECCFRRVETICVELIPFTIAFLDRRAGELRSEADQLEKLASEANRAHEQETYESERLEHLGAEEHMAALDAPDEDRREGSG